jgi:hypothetical protein
MDATSDTGSPGATPELVGGSPVLTKPNPVVSIVGAGVKFVGNNFRSFVSPMHRWLCQMPERMLLESESSCASSLHESRGIDTLARYREVRRIEYSDFRTPVSRALSSKHALSFQRTLVPEVRSGV